MKTGQGEIERVSKYYPRRTVYYYIEVSISGFSFASTKKPLCAPKFGFQDVIRKIEEIDDFQENPSKVNERQQDNEQHRVLRNIRNQPSPNPNHQPQHLAVG